MITPLLLNQFTRELWSEYDAYVISQLEPAFKDGCYEPKIYKAPDLAQEIIPAGGYLASGLQITPGALILGFYAPWNPEVNPATTPTFLVQITDVGLEHKFYSEPVPAYFLCNTKLDMPNMLPQPHPVVAPGTFLFELWNVSGAQVRVQLCIVVLEPKV